MKSIIMERFVYAFCQYHRWPAGTRRARASEAMVLNISSTKMYFIYLCYISDAKWQKMEIYLCKKLSEIFSTLGMHTSKSPPTCKKSTHSMAWGQYHKINQTLYAVDTQYNWRDIFLYPLATVTIFYGSENYFIYQPGFHFSVMTRCHWGRHRCLQQML